MKNQDFIAIVDYQLSNMFSVKHVFDHFGINAIITSDPKVVTSARGAVLPGVGAFGDAMGNLKKFGLDKALLDLVASGKPLLGVCLGLQLLFDESTEFGKHKGLGLIAGDVVKFSNKGEKDQVVRIPQIGWNTIQKPAGTNWTNTPFSTLKDNSFMYFVHSFFVRPKEKKLITSLTTYGGVSYCSSIAKGNIFATQFHPEKSAKDGIQIYKNWIQSF